ncbi:MAG TPA: hypothetical protein VMS31_19210, partial [Pyrinomonadaceae bacterium]|nr:hypothetical protein [Pyrinomonadaceae bacterium]
MIQFHIDQAGFDGHIKCGTINYFGGWVVSGEPDRRIAEVKFYVDQECLGRMPVRQERPDLERIYQETLLGFASVVDIPDEYLGRNLTLKAVAEDGQEFPLTEYPLTERLSDAEKDFRREHNLPDDLLIHLVAFQIEPRVFLGEGKAGVDLIKQILNKHQISLDALENILDFGTGCGRVLRWWEEHSDRIQFWG